VARTRDLSVLWTNLNSRSLAFKPLVRLVVMQNCPFDLQRLVIRGGMNASRVSVGCGDSTGMGIDTNETFEREFKDRWQGVNFGGTRKRELASSLATAYSEGTQALPSMEHYGFIHADIFAIQKDESNGRFDLDETENPLMPESHCDIAWANALSRRAGAIPMLPPLPVHTGGRPIGL
jgi:phage FluMu gp28-like protein